MEYKNNLSWLLTEAICTNNAVHVQKIINKGVCLNPQPRLDDGIAAVKEAAFNLPFVKALRANAGEEVLQVLQEAGANYDVPNIYGMSTLYFAAMDNKPLLAQKLLDLKSPVDGVTYRGETPLHAAVYYLNNTCVDTLINAGANVYAKNDDGVSPIELFNVVYRARGQYASQEEKKAFMLIRKALMRAAIKHCALLREGASDLDFALLFESKPLLCQPYPLNEKPTPIKPLLVMKNRVSYRQERLFMQMMEEKQAVNS